MFYIFFIWKNWKNWKKIIKNDYNFQTIQTKIFLRGTKITEF